MLRDPYRHSRCLQDCALVLDQATDKIFQIQRHMFRLDLHCNHEVLQMLKEAACALHLLDRNIQISLMLIGSEAWHRASHY